MEKMMRENNEVREAGLAERDPLLEFVQRNREAFLCGELPEGMRERFEQKLFEQKLDVRKPVVRLRRMVAGIGLAASLLLAAGVAGWLLSPLGSAHWHYRKAVSNYERLLSQLDAAIPALPEQYGESVSETLSALIAPPVPFEEQIPQFLPQAEKYRLMTVYYEWLTEGLARIRDIVAVQ